MLLISNNGPKVLYETGSFNTDLSYTEKAFPVQTLRPVPNLCLGVGVSVGSLGPLHTASISSGRPFQMKGCP